jgi:hypothetical protein
VPEFSDCKDRKFFFGEAVPAIHCNLFIFVLPQAQDDKNKKDFRFYPG